MADKNYIAVLDASLFVWDVADYKGNEYDYRLILDAISDMIEKLSDQSFLVTKELIDELIHYFPYSDLPESLWEFGNIIYKFFQKLFSKVINSDSTLESLVSSPNQKKPYFSSSLKIEVNKLLNHLYHNDSKNHIYFSSLRFWDDSDSLKLVKSNSKEVRAILIDKENRLKDFVNDSRLIFDHHDKHDCSEHKNLDAWLIRDINQKFDSQLSSFCNGNTERVQKILDKRFGLCFGNENFFGYDNVTGVFVKFRLTNAKIYHAHDEYDINKIPEEVKNHFSIHKYSWS